ncbi:MAG: TolC family protein [Gemmataceae bacterium]
MFIGCNGAPLVDNIILPEARTVKFHDPAQLPPAKIPDAPPPRTVADSKPNEPQWQLSLDDAIRCALENAKVIRVLAGLTATTSGQTIYDPAITNTTIDQEQARFDPVFTANNHWARTETPTAVSDPLDPTRTFILGSSADTFRSEVGVSQTNVLGGQTSFNYVTNPTRFGGLGVAPLNPQNNSAFELNYTQPLLQGGGFQVNTAPIVIARLNTSRSYFQYKDSVQELVRSVIEGYWNLVQARTDAWARKIQVQQSQAAFEREQARLESGLADLKNVVQARATYTQFKAALIAADANVLAREGALRNLLGLPPEDCRQLVPVSPPTVVRLRPDWCPLVRLAAERRPDVVELKLVLEADRVRRLQAENQALPRLDAVGQYRWNGLDGTMPSGDRLATGGGQFTDWTLGLNFSVPLGLRQGRAQVRQQSLLIWKDQANVDQSVHAAVHELAATIRDLDSAYEQYRALSEARAAAFENLKVQNEQFRFERAIYLNVLQALNDWGNAVSAEAQALLSYNIALATLERQTGTILETHGLVFVEERFRAAGPLGILGSEREYPEAMVPSGVIPRYLTSPVPSEQSFDLRNPDPHAPK